MWEAKRLRRRPMTTSATRLRHSARNRKTSMGDHEGPEGAARRSVATAEDEVLLDHIGNHGGCQQRCESGQNQRWGSEHSLRGGVSPSRVAW